MMKRGNKQRKTTARLTKAKAHETHKKDISAKRCIPSVYFNIAPSRLTGKTEKDPSQPILRSNGKKRRRKGFSPQMQTGWACHGKQEQ